MATRVIRKVDSLTRSLGQASEKAKELSKYLSRTKGGSSGGSQRHIVITGHRAVPGVGYYDETSRRLGL